MKNKNKECRLNSKCMVPVNEDRLNVKLHETCLVLASAVLHSGPHILPTKPCYNAKIHVSQSTFYNIIITLLIYLN